MSRPLAVLFCPGRGSYGRTELGTLARWLRPGPVWEALQEADRLRSERDAPTITELDAAEQFRPGVHLDGRNAAELIYFSTLASWGALRERYEIAAVAGNSLGWYTALVVAGALDPKQGAELVRSMANLQDHAHGGQLLTTTLGADWQPDPALMAAIDDALRTVNSAGEELFVARSIRLGGHEVLGGTATGIERLLATLPEVQTDSRQFPLRLAGHGPFHTRLCDEVVAHATDELRYLPVRQPEIHLIDGRGMVHTPWSTDPRELRHYTLDLQVRTTFDFTAAVRTAMREFNPDVLLCAGPGQSLRAPVGHVVLAEGWRGITSRGALFASELIETA